MHAAPERQPERSCQSVDTLAENWLRQHLDLERYPELEWHQGPGGWRTGINGTAIDAYTVVGYSQAGYSPQEIASELLPDSRRSRYALPCGITQVPGRDRANPGRE